MTPDPSGGMSTEEMLKQPVEVQKKLIEELRKSRSSASWNARKIAEIQALSDNLQTFQREAFGLLKEFVRVGVSNPVVGAASAVIVVDILRKANLVSDNVEGIVDGIAAATVGVTLAIDAASAATNIIDTILPFDMFKAPATPPNPLAPTAQVVVFSGSEGSERILKGLSGLMLPEAKYVEGKGF